MEGNEKTVNIFTQPAGGGGIDAAATIMAMGNRNEAGGLAALAPALMAGRRDEGMGGFGAGFIGGVVGGAIGRRVLGGDGCDGVNGGAETRLADGAANLAILSKLGNLEAAVPLAEAQVQLALAGTQNFLAGQATVNATAAALSHEGIKDSVQNTGTVILGALNTLNTNVLTTASQTQLVIKDDGEKTRALINQVDRDRLLHERDQFDRDRRDGIAQLARQQTEVNVTQNVTNVARADAQASAVAVALSDIGRRLSCIEAGHAQIATAVNRTIQFGTGNVAANTNTANNAH